ncbi:hypothetical protein [uncultured Psychroserpens sp.]|uniref:hypothetical protein n=1 Tax=uncultured Psychroserpens sp. TaxID=255436 RepID=UPI00260BC888|nr:hypothetical protein [uncultured Psychroserpens sp.]
MKTRFILSILLMPVLLVAQNDFSFSSSDFSYGIGTKLTIELLHKNRPDFKLSITGGVGYNASINDNYGITPSIHGGILLFNKGMVGANQSKKWYKIQAHTFLNTTATFQLDKLDFNPLERPVPLYHFAEFTANPLQNPFKSSISYGMNLILVQDNILQRTGFFNLNIAGRFQISYYNDGGPVLGWAGDNRDRYYTGGLVLSYHGYINDVLNLIELSYHKYTGYQEYAFDVGEHLQIDFINYYDTTQFTYNQQRWRLNFSNLDNGFGGSISWYNKNRIDLQDFLHFTTNVPYHPDYFTKSRWMFGIRHEYNNSKL